MKNIKAVLFDMDGVIFDTERLILDCWVEMGLEYGFGENVREVFSACIGTNKEKTKEIVLENFGQDFKYDEFSKLASQLFKDKTAEDGIPVKKGVRETLEELKNMDIPIGLASSTRTAIVKEELSAAGLLRYFDVVVGGDLLKRSKPEPDIYLMACKNIGFKPEDCVAIEDSYNGIISAYRAGITPVMVPDLLPPTEKMREMSEIILNDLTEFVPWLKATYRV